jgi:chitinase
MSLIRNALSVAAAAVVPLSCGRAPSATPAPAASPSRIVGYLASWGVRSKGTRIAELPGGELTHIIYAFARITDDGRNALGDPCVDIGECNSNGAPRSTDGGNFAELRKLKERYPNLKLLVAIGGWTGSGRFSDVAVSSESRRAFAQSALDLVIRRSPGLFDGIDIDWEYPVGGGLATNSARPEDRDNCTLLLQQLREELDAQGTRDGRQYLLTIATIAGASAPRHFDLVKVSEVVDWYNVMTYDYHSGSKVAHFNAPLYTAAGDPTPGYTVDSTVQRYIAGGVPRTKIVVGLPFYGRVYGGVGATNDGVFQPAPGPVPDDWKTGTDYRAIVRRDLQSLGFRRVMHPEARVPFLYNPATGTWVTYDDAESVAEKVAYVRSHGLGGVMAWEIGGDDGTLVRTFHQGLTGGQARDGRSKDSALDLSLTSDRHR